MKSTIISISKLNKSVTKREFLDVAREWVGWVKRNCIGGAFCKAKYEIRRITEDFYNKKLKEYSEKQSKILQEINKHNEADKDHYFTINTVLNLAQRAKEIFESSETNEQRHLVNFLVQNLELRDRTLEYELKTPFNTIIFFKNKTKSRAFNPASSAWLRGQDSNKIRILPRLLPTSCCFR